MSDVSLEEIAEVVTNGRIRDTEHGRELRCGCPAHDGRDRNCSIRFAGDGKLLAHCHSKGCGFQSILEGIERRLGRPLSEPEQRTEIIVGNEKKREVAPKTAPEMEARQRPDITAQTAIGRKTWDVRDAGGSLIAHHVRTDYSDGTKKVIWKRPGERWGLGGLRTAELPLYGAHEVSVAPPDAPVIVTEGEKAADAVRLTGMLSVGTVTGAKSVPNPGTLEVLRDRAVILWADNDSNGVEHMKKIGVTLLSIASEVRWFQWPDAPEKGDAADHPGTLNGGREALRNMLLDAPAFNSSDPNSNEPGHGHFRRVDLGDIMRNPPPPPDMLVRDILYPGRVHCLFSEGGMGKTFFALWLSSRVMEKGGKVVFCDNENGQLLLAERMRDMGVDSHLISESLVYYPFPDSPITPAATQEFAMILDTEKPDLVVFDSWINFLAGAGLDENSAVDIAAWGTAYSQQARKREVACLILDHPGKERDTEPRGSSRKSQYVDVNLQFLRPQHFDRDTIGRVEIRVMKDREGWLPMGSAFRFGGDGNQLICERTMFDSAIAVGNSILASDRAVLSALESFGASGSIDKSWKEEAMKRGVAKSTYYKSKSILLDEDFVSKDSERYYANTTKTIQKTEGKGGQKGDGNIEVYRGPSRSNGPNRPTPSGARSTEVHSPYGGSGPPPVDFVDLAPSEAGPPTMNGLIQRVKMEVRSVGGEERVFVYPESITESEGKFIRAHQSEFVARLREEGLA